MKKYYIVPKASSGYDFKEVMEPKINWSRIIGVVAAFGSAAAAAAGILDQVNPKTALYLMVASAAISAFTKEVQGTK